MLIKDLKINQLIKNNKVYLTIGNKKILLNTLPKKNIKILVKKYKNEVVNNFKQESKIIEYGCGEICTNIFYISISDFDDKPLYTENEYK